MANYRYDWAKEYPEGTVKYSTRHLSKTTHGRLEILATLLKMSTEMAHNKALEIGLVGLEEELKRIKEVNGERYNSGR